MTRFLGATVRSMASAAVCSLATFSCSGSDDTAAGGANDLPTDAGGHAGASAGRGGKDASVHGGASGGGTGGADASIGSGGDGATNPQGGASSGGQPGLDVDIGPIDGGPPPLTVCRDLAVSSARRVQFDAAADKLLLVRESGPTVMSMNPWKTVVTFGGHRSWVVDAALSPDGARAASVGDDGMLRE